MAIDFESVPENNRVHNLTEQLNSFTNPEKIAALKILSQFDIEWCEDRQLVRHYVCDQGCRLNDEKDLQKALEEISNSCWLTFNHHIQRALGTDKVIGLLSESTWDERKQPVKLGKIYTCGPNRFDTVNVKVALVQPYVFAYNNLKDNFKELMGEINFGIEIY